MVLSWIKLGAHPILEDLHLYTYILHPSIHACMHTYIHMYICICICICIIMSLIAFRRFFRLVPGLPSIRLSPSLWISTASQRAERNPAWSMGGLSHENPGSKGGSIGFLNHLTIYSMFFFFLNHIWITVISFLWQSCLIFKKVIMENQCSISFLEINLRISYNPCIIVF